MTSSATVVRSLSADELASSLTRTPNLHQQQQQHSQQQQQQQSQQHSTNNPVVPNPPLRDHKPKNGLLKRLRRAFRINAQSHRSRHHDKSSTRHQQQHSIHAQPPRRAQTTANLYATSPNLDYDAIQQRDPSRDIAAVMPSNAPSPPNPQPNTKKQPTVPRAGTRRTWRSGNPRASERSAVEIGDAKAGDSRRFIGLRSNDPKKSSPSMTSLGLSNPDHTTNPPPNPSRSSGRSLPKRVFSSPPSLTARTFASFTHKKRTSATGKNGIVRNGTYTTDVVEGGGDSVKKIARAMTARNPVGENRIQTNPNSTANGADQFVKIVDGAAAGRVSFAALMDAMFRLEERLETDVKDKLITYLGRQENMEALIDQLTVFEPAKNGHVENALQERERYRFSYVASMLLSNGPIRLRRSLFFNPKHLDRLVRVLGHGTPSDPIVVRSVCKVLLSVLRDSPEDTVRAMGRRKDFISALLTHISITGCPEVCLSMLSTVRCQSELKFGPSNKPVVGMMADSKLLKTLCDKMAAAAEGGPLTGTTSSTIENCSRVIVGIALRVLVIPRYEINDDDSDASFMRKFNRDLSSLDVFTNPEPVLRLLDSGLAALSTHDTRGYALSTALTAVRYLLVTALNGQDSSLSTIRLQLLTVNTSSYEGGLRARIPKMAAVLENARAGVVVETMWEKVESPLGVVRLKILELIVVLLQHCSASTAKAISKAQIPRILMDLFVRLKLNSLLQHFVAVIVELSFTGEFACLRRSFLIDVRLMDRVMELWKVSEESMKENIEEGSGRRKNPVNYTGELLRMSCAIHDFLKSDSPEVKEFKRELGPNKIDTFRRFVEGPIAQRLKDNGPLMSGPGELPQRQMDSFGIDGYSSMDGSQGSLFLRSRGPGTTVNT